MYMKNYPHTFDFAVVFLYRYLQLKKLQQLQNTSSLVSILVKLFKIVLAGDAGYSSKEMA